MRLRGMLPLLLVPILPLWAGCVIYEESEERVQIDAERGIARHTVTEFNIESAETTAQAHGVDARGGRIWEPRTIQKAMVGKWEAQL